MASAWSLAAFILLAGCAAHPAVTVTVTSTATPSATSTTQDQAGSTQLKLWATDAPDGVDQFAALIVQLDGVELAGANGNVTLQPTTGAFDLARLANGAGVLVYDGPTPSGAYDQVTLHVATAVGTLQDGSVIAMAGGPLTVASTVSLAPDDTVHFLFDIQAQQGDNGDWSLVPVQEGSHLGMPSGNQPVPAPQPTPRPTTPTPTTTSKAPPPAPGRLVVYLTAVGNVSDFRGLNVTVQRMHIAADTNTTITTLGGATNLLALQGGQRKVVSNSSVPAGAYTGLDMLLGTMSGTLANGTKATVTAPLLVSTKGFTVPSGGVESVVVALRVTRTGSAATLSIDATATKVYAGYPPKVAPPAPPTKLRVYLAANGTGDFRSLNITVANLVLVGKTNQTVTVGKTFDLVKLGNGTLLLELTVNAGNRTAIILNVTAASGKLTTNANATLAPSRVTFAVPFTVKAASTTMVLTEVKVTKSGTHYVLGADAGSKVLTAAPA